MSEELETELSDESKFEQWMKKQKFNDNLEKIVRLAEETKEQFEEKYQTLHGDIENVTSEIKEAEVKLGTVDDRIGTVDKSIEILGTGIDRVNEDVKKFQTSQDSLEKFVQEKYQTLHGDIENVTSEIKEAEVKLGTVDDRIGKVDKSIETLGTGIDRVNEDVKKFQATQDSLEKLVQEKIPVLAGNMENVTSAVKNVEIKLGTVDDRLSKVDKSIGTFRTGIDHVNEDIKKFQTSQGSLEKLVKEKISVLSGNIENVSSEIKNVEIKFGTIDESIGILCTGIDYVMKDVKKFQISQDSLEKLVQEKIPVLSGNMENVTSEVKDVEVKLGTVNDRLGTVDKSIEMLCTGIDRISEDTKKFQTSHDSLEKLLQEKYQTLYEDLEKSYDVLEKLVQARFEELGEKVQSLERPLFACENCGELAIAPLSSYCPNCGSEIQSWSDEDGQPIRGWTPYWKRLEKNTSTE